MSRSLLFASALLFAPAFGAAPAAAQDVHYQVVHYGDLDLNYRPDAHRMVHRINRAARNVCADTPGVQTIDQRRGEAYCRTDAEERAVSDTGSATVADVYYGRHPEVIVGDDEAPPPPPPAYDPYGK